MAKNKMVWLVVLLLLVAGMVYVQLSKTRYTATDERVFTGKREDVQQVVIERDGNRIELRLEGETWRLVGHDSLTLRQPPMDNLFNNVLTVKRTTLMTESPDRWQVYSVDDSSGIRLTVMDAGGEVLAAFVFGQSRQDWSKNYVRVASEDEVYLTDNNITYYLNATPLYWGEKPKPATADSTAGEVEVDVSAPATSSLVPRVQVEAKRDTTGPMRMEVDVSADTTDKK